MDKTEVSDDPSVMAKSEVSRSEMKGWSGLSPASSFAKNCKRSNRVNSNNCLKITSHESVGRVVKIGVGLQWHPKPIPEILFASFFIMVKSSKEMNK